MPEGYTAESYLRRLCSEAALRRYGSMSEQVEERLEQVVQLIMDVAGFTAAQADELRRAFARSHSDHLVAMHRERFLEGSQSKGVTEEAARKIFAKINGHYMFPESHSHAFAVTAYQAAWLKRYHPLEFFLTLMNNQPMGFYPLETLKEDAKRFGVTFRNPCVNRSKVRCVPEQGCVLLGLQLIKDVGESAGRLIVEERDRHGAYTNAGDLVRRRRGSSPRRSSPW